VLKFPRKKGSNSPARGKSFNAPGEDANMTVRNDNRISSKEYRNVVFASVFGTIIEWYDFLIYGTAAALVFNKLFFPSYDPLVGTLAALAAYGVGFLGRPLGAIIFGHYGDRIGRKSMLIATMLTMGLATFAVGCLPTYEQIGIWAPTALVVLRILQGIGLVQ
jgi:MHS family shikimate/dehydroshikimate transporter-like MFS transporter